MTNLGELIRFHRERRGWKQYELARRAEMSAAQVSYIENNRVSPSFHAVERLARAFDTDIAGLLSKKGLADGERPPVVAAAPVASVSGDYQTLRAMERDGAAALAAILDEERRADAAELARGIVNAYTLGAGCPAFSEAITGAALAEILRGELGLGTAPAGDLAATLAFRGVRVYRKALPKETASVSFWQRVRQRPAIVLNAGNTRERDLYRLAYELGSIGLFRALEHVIDETLVQHRFLVDFAVSFLMPSLTVRQAVAATGIGPEDWTFSKLVALKGYFGVSAESFALRLEELGLIAPGLRLRLREQLRAYYRAHPDAMEPHPAAPSINPATIGEEKQ
ncbi:MAG: helix-turn-helix domain-containing protein [Kiritimatiellia bacterium]